MASGAGELAELIPAPAGHPAPPCGVSTAQRAALCIDQMGVTVSGGADDPHVRRGRTDPLGRHDPAGRVLCSHLELHRVRLSVTSCSPGSRAQSLGAQADSQVRPTLNCHSWWWIRHSSRGLLTWWDLSLLLDVSEGRSTAGRPPLEMAEPAKCCFTRQREASFSCTRANGGSECGSWALWLWFGW
jgi:hypothetical protein